METVKALKERRSINFFEPGKKIPDAKIKKLLNLANLSPSSRNLQPWELIIVDDPDRKEDLKKCAGNQAKVAEASAVFIIIANPSAIEENIDDVLNVNIRLGYTKPEAFQSSKASTLSYYGEKDSLRRKIFAIKNTSFFAMSLMIAAKDMGLETHPMDGFNEDMIKKEFNIPEEKIIPLILAIGYLKKGVKLLPRAYRRAPEKFVKYNNY
ncbi:MAG: nitroreductase family protein [Spirochaetota bacterium]